MALSHKFRPGATLSDARIWSFLELVDEQEDERCRSNGSPHCGGDLHGASYTLKPRIAKFKFAARRSGFPCRALRQVLPQRLRQDQRAAGHRQYNTGEIMSVFPRSKSLRAYIKYRLYFEPANRISSACTLKSASGI